jgi:hypothetical protein
MEAEVMTKRDVFREMYGNELADQVEQLKRKPTGVEVLKPRPKQPEQQAKPATEELWWNR